jgi:hypothetical protein
MARKHDGPPGFPQSGRRRNGYPEPKDRSLVFLPTATGCLLSGSRLGRRKLRLRSPHDAAAPPGSPLRALRVRTDRVPPSRRAPRCATARWARRAIGLADPSQWVPLGSTGACALVCIGALPQATARARQQAWTEQGPIPSPLTTRANIGPRANVASAGIASGYAASMCGWCGVQPARRQGVRATFPTLSRCGLA